MVVTRSQTATVTSAGTGDLKSTDDGNKQPKSTKRSRPFNRTQKRIPSPSPPAFIHQQHSQLSETNVFDNNTSSTKSYM